MEMPCSLRRWLRLPGRLALILGMGALTTTSVRADLPEQNELTPSSGALIRSEDGKIYLSENGRETELGLRATPQRDHLLRLLEQHGPAGIRLDPDPRLIMSGGGGSGFSLWDLKKSVTEQLAPARQDPPQGAAPPNLPKRESAPREPKPANDKKG
jgi:hypothetical protein